MSGTKVTEAGAGAELRPSDRVLAAIAERAGTSPLEFDRPLYDFVDLDALDALFRRDAVDATVEFIYLGYRVCVHGDGNVTVTEREGC